MVPAIAVTLIALVAVLAGERKGMHAVVWIAKPVASGGFIALALAAGALQWTYGTMVLTALVLSLAGDVLLIPRSNAAFRAGLLALLCAHLAFAGAFLVRGIALTASLAAVAVLAVAGVIVHRWLLSHLSGVMRVAVPAYIIAIVSMTAFAIGTAVRDPGSLIAAGAIAFFLSDLSVARDRFVAKSFVNRLWGLPLYYAAQIALASSMARDAASIWR